MAITCELDIAIGCVLAPVCKNVCSVCLPSTMAVSVIFAMLQSCVYSDMGVELLHIHPCIYIYNHTWIHKYTYKLMNVWLHAYLNV